MSYAYRTRKKNLRRMKKFYSTFEREVELLKSECFPENKEKIVWWKRIINWFRNRIKDWKEITEIESEYKRNSEFGEKFQ